MVTSALSRLPKFLNLLLVVSVYLFLYVPIAVLIIFSFNEKAFPSAWDSFTLRWYSELFNSKELWGSFFNSLIIATLSTLISLAMGVMLIFFRASGGRVKKLLPLFYGNLIIPETVLAVSLLTFFSVIGIPLGLPTVIVSHSVIGMGFVIPVLYSKYIEINPRLMEASMILGASPSQTFRKIILPMLIPSMIGTGLLVFVISFDDFIISYFCSGTSLQTLSIYLFSTIKTGISPVVNALSAILFSLTGLFVLLYFYSRKKSRKY